MQPRRGPPIHPSLPPNPLLYNNPGYVAQPTHGSPQNTSANVGAMAAQALTSSLANPYGNASNNHYSYTNANYHAYFNQMQHSATTAQGYTLSSTYVPQPAGPSGQSQHQAWPQAQRGRAPSHHTTNNYPRSFGESSFSAPGDTRCAHEGCSFTGSKKTVEIHMMDRHLIFPPGWKKRKQDWDADPSLKGKPVPIPGTGVTLNTPEAIDAWVAERKKRWPSNQVVDDKKRKAQEAADRGEIDPSELTKSRKRRRVEGESQEQEGRGRGGGRGRGRGRGEFRGGKTDSGWRGRGRGGRSTSHPRPEIVSEEAHVQSRGDDPSTSEDDGSSSEESGSDVDPVKDAVSSKAPNLESGPRIFEEILGAGGQQIIEDCDPPIDESVASKPDQTRNGCRPHRRALHPKAPPSNPFASRPSLLRNLLLPEIRHTVSNLSQTIHFLVENEFLQDVELKPGDADSHRIKVLESTTVAEQSCAKCTAG